jgi:cell division protein FtsQ
VSQVTLKRAESLPGTDAATVRGRRRSLKRIPQQDAPSRFRWRYVSLGMVFVLLSILAFLFNADLFVVKAAEIGDARYVPVEEIFAESGVAGQRIMMIDPEAVERRLELSPSVDSAEVRVQWPARVIIRIREREPALIWEQAGNRYWVDLNGHLMVERRPLDTLLLVVNEGSEIPFQCPGPLCVKQDEITIDPEVVRGAQHLKTLRSNIDVLYYDPVRGLSYQDGRGWRAYFGIGATMDVKLITYETLVATLEAQGIRPLYIDVSNPNAPYYRVAE